MSASFFKTNLLITMSISYRGIALTEPLLAHLVPYKNAIGMRLPLKDPDEWLYGEEVEKAIHEARSYGSDSNHYHCCK